MKLYNNLPLTPSLYRAQLIYYFYEKIIFQDIETTIEDGKLYFSDPRELKPDEKWYWYNLEKLDKKTFRNIYESQISWIDADDFVVAMPFVTWEKVARELRTLSAGPRKRIARVFLYIYYWAMRFQGSYSRPREMIVKELGIQKDNLADALTWLEQKGLVMRTDYSKQGGYARRYYIPEELWNYQCKKEWQELQKSLKK